MNHDSLVTVETTAKDVVDMCNKFGLRIDALRKRGACFTLILTRGTESKMGEADDLCVAFHRALAQYQFLGHLNAPCS